MRSSSESVTFAILSVLGLESFCYKGAPVALSQDEASGNFACNGSAWSGHTFWFPEILPQRNSSEKAINAKPLSKRTLFLHMEWWCIKTPNSHVSRGNFPPQWISGKDVALLSPTSRIYLSELFFLLVYKNIGAYEISVNPSPQVVHSNP